MAQPQTVKYVNRMLNVAYITGTVIYDPENPRRFFVRQTANSKLDIPIDLPDKIDSKRPKEKEMFTITGHVRGRNEDGVQTAYVESLFTNTPSILNVNPLTSYLSGYAKQLTESEVPEWCPYNSKGQLKPEFIEKLRKELSEDEKVIIDLYERNFGKIGVSFASYANVVMLAGIVHSCQYIPPNPHQSHPTGILMLRQHEDLNNLIPVRIVSPKLGAIIQKLKPGYPISLKGRMRRKLVLSPDGQEILQEAVYVETDMISAAGPLMIMKPIPSWFVEYLKNARREEENVQELNAE